MDIRRQNVTLIYNDDFTKKDVNTSLQSIQKAVDNITLTMNKQQNDPDTNDQAAIEEINRRLGTITNTVNKINGNYVTTDSTQTIGSNKTFTTPVRASSFVKKDATNEDVLLGDGTTIKVDDISGKANKSLPIGSIVSYAGATIPAGYLLCNGQTFDTTAYSELYGVLGKETVPDLTDRFIMGPGRNERDTYVEEGLPNITGGTGGLTSGNDSAGTDAQFGSGYGAIRNQTKTGPGSSVKSTGWQIQNGFTFDAKRSNSIYGKSSHVQPASYVSYFIIKAKYELDEVPQTEDLSVRNLTASNNISVQGNLTGPHIGDQVHFSLSGTTLTITDV